MIRSIFDIYGTPVLIAIFLILFLVEGKLELRKRVQNRRKRVFINFLFSIPAFALLRILFIPAMVWLAVKDQTWQIGLNYLIGASAVVKSIVAFVLLDYSNYTWHILLHKLPVLWRFHLVHHTDLDLDVSTAFRFHFVEIIASVFFRGAALIIIGASPAVVLIYEIVFEAASQFHHSNMRLPFHLEKILNYFIVTPRMHGIHHSMIKKETDSNYAVIFSFWDRLHKTVRLNIHQNEIVTGVPAFAQEDLTIGRLLKLPFTKIPEWKDNDRTSNDKMDQMKP
ncbi:MAG: sterol desaturase family protein [Ferruginibacter sp.]